MKSFRNNMLVARLLGGALIASLALGCGAEGLESETLAELEGNLKVSQIIGAAQEVAKASASDAGKRADDSADKAEKKVRPDAQKANPMKKGAPNVTVQAGPQGTPVKVSPAIGPVAVNPVPIAPPCTSDVDIDKSLVVTDAEALSRFPLQDVMDQLVSLANVSNTTGTSLFQQWWSAQRERDNTTDPAHFPFCDDNGSTLNGYPIDCPRAESELENFDPETHFPVALFNRFDMAPLDGSHCGEYRVVYAKHTAQNGGGVGGRNFAIFEAILPNPNPECGVAGCLPVAEFWAELTDENDPVVRANKLEDFYFNGLADFSPVIHPANYGMIGSSSGYGGGKNEDTPTGQIRTNQFVQFKWTLREFQLERVCMGGGIMDADMADLMEADAEASMDADTDSDMTDEEAEAEEMATADMADFMDEDAEAEEDDKEGKTDAAGGTAASKQKLSSATQASGKKAVAPSVPVCELVMMPRPVAGSPFIELWDDNHANSSSYQGDFLMQLGLLNPTPDGLLKIGMSVFPEYWAAEGVSQGGFSNSSEYNASTNFATQIAAELANSGNPNGLTVQHIAERTNAMTCAGCHQASSFKDLGNGVTWPGQNPSFVHTDENSNLSTLLTMPGGFLEHRKNVLDDFLVTMCVLNDPCDPNAIAVTSDGQVVAQSKMATGPSNGQGDAAAAPLQPKESLLPQSEQTLGGSTIH